MFGEFAVLAFSAILINNILLIQYLGNCPFLGTSKKMETATGMAMAVVFVLVLAGIITWLVERYVLVPFDLQYLRTIAFILVIAALVQFVEMFLKKSIPGLYTGLGIYLPLITTNCAVLGIPLLNVQTQHNFVESLFFGAGGAIGFTLVLILFAGIRERLDTCDVPAPFKGTSIAMITAGLMSLAFMGFSGLVK